MITERSALKFHFCRSAAFRSAALLALLSTGCLGPRYVRPAVTTPSSFREATTPDAGWKPAEPANTVLRGAWWRLYDDTLLDSLEERAAVSNQNIVAAAAQYRQARALVRAARAGYFPFIGAEVAPTRQLRSSNTGGTSVSTGRSASPFSDYLLSGDAAWEPDIWGKVAKTVRAGRAGAQAVAADLASVNLSIQAEVAQDFFCRAHH